MFFRIEADKNRIRPVSNMILFTDKELVISKRIITIINDSIKCTHTQDFMVIERMLINLVVFKTVSLVKS